MNFNKQKKRKHSQRSSERKQNKKLKISEVIGLTNEEESEERKIQYFDCLPRDMEIIILSFVISESEKKNWNNISLVSKHWNSIAWISFQRTIPTSEKEEIFIQACQKGKFHFINKLLTQDTTFDPSFQHNYAIAEVRFFPYIDIINLLLEDRRVDPSANNNLAIRKASIYDCIDVVKLLLQDKRVDPSDKDNEAITLASYYGNIDVVKLLLKDKRVDPSAIDCGKHLIYTQH